MLPYGRCQKLCWTNKPVLYAVYPMQNDDLQEGAESSVNEENPAAAENQWKENNPGLWCAMISRVGEQRCHWLQRATTHCLSYAPRPECPHDSGHLLCPLPSIGQLVGLHHAFFVSFSVYVPMHKMRPKCHNKYHWQRWLTEMTEWGRETVTDEL